MSFEDEVEDPESTEPEEDPSEASSASPKVKKSKKTIQIRTLVERTGMEYKEMKKLFIAAGMKTRKLRFLSKVNIEEALAALKIVALPDPPLVRNIETETIQREEADLAAAMKSGSFIEPSSKATGSGRLSDDPVPQAVLDGDYVEQVDAFPYPKKELWPPDLIISALNINNSQIAEAHRQAKLSIGWRFIDDKSEKLLNRLYPDARWRRMVNAQGLIFSGDLALACFPRAAWEKRKARQRGATTERLGATRESFAANIEDSQRDLQNRHGIPGSRHISPIIEDSVTAADRADFESRKNSGDDPRASRVGLGRASTSR